MIPEKYIELINQEIDGVNTPEESAELQEYIRRNPEGQRYFDELSEVAQSFLKIEAVDPPPQLRSLIVSRIEQAIPEKSIAAEKERRGSSRKSRRDVFVPPRDYNRRPRWGYAFAFAAGLVVGICMLGIFMKTLPEMTPSDLEKLYGSIMSSFDKADLVEEIPIDIDHPSVSGRATFQYSKDDILTLVRLQSAEPVQVVFEYSDDVHFNGFKTLDREHYNIDIKKGSTSLSHAGKLNIAVFFKNTHRAPSAVDMRIISQGRPIFQKMIMPRRK